MRWTGDWVVKRRAMRVWGGGVSKRLLVVGCLLTVGCLVHSAALCLTLCFGPLIFLLLANQQTYPEWLPYEVPIEQPQTTTECPSAQRLPFSSLMESAVLGRIVRPQTACGSSRTAILDKSCQRPWHGPNSARWQFLPTWTGRSFPSQRQVPGSL